MQVFRVLCVSAPWEYQAMLLGESWQSWVRSQFLGSMLAVNRLGRGRGSNIARAGAHSTRNGSTGKWSVAWDGSVIGFWLSSRRGKGQGRGRRFEAGVISGG